MACSIITKGRKMKCDKSVGGIKAIYIAAYDEDFYANSGIKATGHYDTDTRTDNNTFFKYEVNSFTATFDQASEVNRANGSVSVNQTLSAQVTGYDIDTVAQADLMNSGKYIIYIETYSGDDAVMGAQFGARIAINTASGAGLGDFQGFTITATGKELKLAPGVDTDVKPGGDNAFGLSGTNIEV